MANANDFLMGSSIPSAFGKNDPVGTAITGTIISTEIRQQTDLESGKPLEWDNGDPRMQLVMLLQTDQRDPANADDDGQRAIYVKGSKAPGSQSLHDAVRAAVQAANAPGLEVGGTVTITFTGTEPSKTRGYNDRKLWAATYIAPDKAAASSEFLGTGATPAPAQTAPAAEDPAKKAEAVKTLISIGQDDATIAGAVGLDIGVVAAIRNAA